MKFPSILDKILPQKNSEQEIFSSVVLDEEYAATALWEMGEKGIPHVLATDSKPCARDDWDARLDAVDEALANVEDNVGTTKYSKVVLGLPPEYLAQNGDIRKEIRPQIKTITRELELTPIGFVSLPQAILYRIKKEEGIPPSVILLDVTRKTITVSLYRVGALTGEFVKERARDTAIVLEEALKEFKNLEVLPARILLYGHDGKALEDVKTELLRYPWTTRVNFLHFPKIEILEPSDIVTSVSLAGASELAHEVGEEDVPAEAVPAVAEADTSEIPQQLQEEETEREAEADESEEGEEIAESESNVVAVDPSRLGFKKDVDVLEEIREPEPEPKTKSVKKLPSFSVPNLSGFHMPDIQFPKGKVPIIAGIIGIILLIGLLYWFAPHVHVAVTTLPKSLTASETITIDPKATTVDAEGKVIPGVSQSKSVSGAKTVPVTGKKDIGDPAKGSVSVYNKTTVSKTFAKGSILTAGTLQFTLDADVQVASASEEVGSITFGKGTGTITASQIGPNSNLQAGTEFHFKDTDSGNAVARNDSALSGGTSKSVTVVSRADQDAFIKAVSADLVDKAKADLSGSVTGNRKLIDETITTAVTQKTFNQEIDQAAKELSGNATLTVSGTAYNADDVKTLLKAMITGQIPSGYTLSDDRTQVTLTNVKVGKDGKISAKATIVSDAIPTINTGDIQKQLAGKTITAAQEYLKGITGIASAEFRFGFTFTKSRLPVNAKNITVSVKAQ